MTSTTSTSPAQPTSQLDRAKAAWERFWFTPMDPIVLGMIRFWTGLLVVYTLAIFTVDLDAFFGAHGWIDLATRMERVRDWPIERAPLRGEESPLPAPRNEREKGYLEAYFREFKAMPPAPYPRDDREMEWLHAFRREFKFDLRLFGLPPPENEFQEEYARDFARRNKKPPGPRYPKDEAEAKQIQAYIDKFEADPRLVLGKGQPIWSVFFDMTDPGEIRRFHYACIGVASLFCLGIATRLTSVLTWVAYMCYINRTTQVLFGADTMVNILLIYLMIGPSGAALSVDRLLGRWWKSHRLGITNKWRGLFGKSALTEAEQIPSSFTDKPEPSIGANFAIRLLQVHLCIIYFMAGLSKLQGGSWWAGTAVWSAIANYEFAPMQHSIYLDTLRFLGHNELVMGLFLFIGTYFTLVFEIGYPFLIWKPSFRWIFLGSAILLHGFIGTLMGLQTFALIMLVMNMGFLTPHEVHRVVDWIAKDDKAGKNTA